MRFLVGKINAYVTASLFALLVVALGPAADVRADVSLPDVLSDSMVLQRGVRVPVWGRAEPGEAVTVGFAGQTKRTTAGADGRWRVWLDSLRSNATPQALTVTGKNRIELKDVLVGEVWLVSGQSNMQFTLAETREAKEAIAAASHPNIRLFNVSRQVAFKHKPPPLAVWRATTPESVKDFSAAGYYFAVEIQRELGVPVGVINSSYGGSQAEAWTPVEYLNASADLKPTVERTKTWDEERPRVKVEYAEQIKRWREEADKARAAGARPSPSPPVPDALREYRVASSIYDGMIEPVIPFPVRGAFWYQGESNEARAEQYGILLPTMIRAWRERWGRGDFPFGIVQLPNYREPKAEPADEAWSHIREAQRRTAVATKNAGLIVTIDVGEARDIHPKNKLDVGRRMARWALAEVYGRRITATGPMFSRMKVVGSKLVLTFEDVGAGLRIRDGDRLQEFAVAGEDRRWRWAEARIVGKDKVEVWSAEVPKPVAARYAFNNNPRRPNLTNDSGLPAAPFRTDDWPDPTAGKR